MNLEHLNLDQHGVCIDPAKQIPVFLIAEELKARKLFNTLSVIGCDGSFCTLDLCDLVLGYAGFDDRPNELYDFYFSLLNAHCESVNDKNHRPVKEAIEIFEALLVEKERRDGELLVTASTSTR